MKRYDNKQVTADKKLVIKLQLTSIQHVSDREKLI